MQGGKDEGLRGLVVKMKEAQKAFLTLGTTNVFIFTPTLGGREDAGNPNFYQVLDMNF